MSFVVALNLATRLDRPEVTGVLVSPRPGGAAVVTQIMDPDEFQDEIYGRNAERLRNWSIAGVIALALASGAGGYALSGMMLRPVRDITRVASEIGASNLSRRINHQGPDDELKALADTFDSMIDRIERSFEQQRQFVQDASHELRTPLAAIRTNIEVAEMDAHVSEEEYRSLFETVKTQTERLTRITEDLLLLTTSPDRAESAREPVTLVDLAREVVSQLRPLATTRDVTLRVEGAPAIEARANPDYLYRCVFNLVENAIKYSGVGSEVVLSAGNAQGRATLAVRDNGAGIPADTLPHVFDRFYRVDKGRSRREGGTGLGLAIVKELVEGMGGSVSVVSTLGAGATFTLSLEQALPEPSVSSVPARVPAAEASL